jgi:hypothetical protein
MAGNTLAMQSGADADVHDSLGAFIPVHRANHVAILVVGIDMVEVLTLVMA